jgi:hypothetical protein
MLWRVLLSQKLKSKEKSPFKDKSEGTIVREKVIQRYRILKKTKKT